MTVATQGMAEDGGSASVGHLTTAAFDSTNSGDGMPQSRRMSLIEALTNVAVGYCMAVAAQVAVFPLFALRVSTGQTLAIGAVFTMVSLARSYLLRRLFERLRAGWAR